MNGVNATIWVIESVIQVISSKIHPVMKRVNESFIQTERINSD